MTLLEVGPTNVDVRLDEDREASEGAMAVTVGTMVDGVREEDMAPWEELDESEDELDDPDILASGEVEDAEAAEDEIWGDGVWSSRGCRGCLAAINVVSSSIKLSFCS